jgi:hypothetical protein
VREANSATTRANCGFRRQPPPLLIVKSPGVNVWDRAIPKLLPSVFLVDVLDDPRGFRFRLVGTAFTQAAGQELTGLRIGEIFPPEFQAQVFDGWNAIVENYGPNWALGMMWLKERDYLQWQGVLLPLQSQNGKIDLLMGAGVFGKTL